MLTRGATSPIDGLRSEKGFTLIELMVTMASGLVVVATLFTVMDVTLQQSTRVFSRIDATSRARTTFEKIENELHSSCVTSAPPIRAGSGSSISFVSDYGSQATVTPDLHTITFNPVPRTLTESVSRYASGISPNTWIFQAPSTRTLLTNVQQSGSAAVFQYFAFQNAVANSSGTEYLDATGAPYKMLLDGTERLPSGATLNGSPVTAGTTPYNSFSPLPASPNLSASDATRTAGIRITLRVGPEGGSLENSNLSDTFHTVRDTVVLRLTPVGNHDISQVVPPCV